MYSQVLRVNIQPGKMDEGIAIFKDFVAPAIHGWRGLQIGRLLVDRAGNKIMAISFWDSQADEASLQAPPPVALDGGFNAWRSQYPVEPIPLAVA